MLLVKGIAEPQNESIRADGYTFTIAGNRTFGSTLFWSASEDPRSLLEIGLNESDGRIVQINAVMASRVSSWSSGYFGIARLGVSQQSGIPLCRREPWSQDNQATHYLRAQVSFQVLLDQERISIQFADPSLV